MDICKSNQKQNRKEIKKNISVLLYNGEIKMCFISLYLKKMNNEKKENELHRPFSEVELSVYRTSKKKIPINDL